MFNLFKVKKLEAQVESLKADLKRAREEASAKVMDDCHACDFVIDWKNLNAFSVERHGGPKNAYTIIGYYAGSGEQKRVEEWKFFCSQEQHNKLAQEFRNGIAKKADTALREYSTST
jgi:hypothetical protein